MYKRGDKCSICGEGVLSDQVVTEDFKYKGHILKIPNYHIFSCDVCGETLVSRETLKRTEKQLTDYRRKIDGLLTSDGIKAIRKKLNLTQVEMAELLGVGKKNFARYENGKVTQSKSMDILLRCLDVEPIILSRIKSQGEMNYKVIDIHSVKPVRLIYPPIKYRLKTNNYEFYEGLANAA